MTNLTDDIESKNKNLLSNEKANGERKKNPPKPPEVKLTELLRFASRNQLFLVVLMAFTSFLIGIAFPINAVSLNFFFNIITNVSTTTVFTESFDPVLRNFACLAAITFVVGFIQMISVSLVAEQQGQNYKKQIFCKCLRQNIHWFDEKPKEQFVMKLINDVDTVELAVSDKFSNFIRQMSAFIGSIAVGLYFEWRLALAGCCTVPLICMSQYSSMFFVKKYTRLQTRSYANPGSIAREILESVKTVVAYNAQDQESQRYRSSLGQVEKYGFKRSVSFGAGAGFFVFFGLMVGSFVYYYGLQFVYFGLLPGSLVMIFLIIAVGSMSLAASITGGDVMLAATAAAYPMMEFLDKKTVNDEIAGQRDPKMFESEIKFENVELRYPAKPGIKVLKNFTFTIPFGKTVAFFGSAECGNSAIIDLLQRNYVPTEGKISFGNFELESIDRKLYHKHTATMYKESPSFSDDVTKTLSFQDDAGETNEIFETNEFLMKKLGSQEQMRLDLVAVVKKNPKLLLIEKGCVAQLKTILDAADRNIMRTVAMATDSVDIAKTADIIVVMKDGQVVAEGSHDELSETTGLYSEMHREQKERMAGGDISIEDDRQIMADRKTEKIPEATGMISEIKAMTQNFKDFARLLRINSPEWFYIVIGSIASVMIGLVFPITALINVHMIQIFGARIAAPEIVLTEGFIFGGLFLLPACSMLVGQILKHACLGKSGEALTSRLRKMLLSAMLQQEMDWFDKKENQTESLSNKLATEVPLVKAASAFQLYLIIESATLVIAILVITMHVSWALSLVFLCFAPFIVLIFVIEGRMVIRHRPVGERKQLSSKIIADSIKNIRFIQSNELEDHFLNLYMDSLKNSKMDIVRRLLLIGFSSAVCISAFYFAFAAVFRVGGILLDKKEIQIFYLMRVFTVYVLGSPALGRTLFVLPEIEKAQTAARNFFKTIDRQPNVEMKEVKPTLQLTGNVEFDDVYFDYSSKPNLRVLNGFTLNIKRGQTVALVGPSGSGKSTVLQLLERFYDVPNKSGQILFDGIDIKDFNIKWLRNGLGLATEHSAIFSMTILENIVYGSIKVDMDRVFKASKVAHIHEFIVALPEGYETKLSRSTNKFSPSINQRICIARALYKNPSILLLDNVSSEFDAEDDTVFQAFLQELKCTCLFKTNRLATVQFFDKIFYVENGSVLESGTHEELMVLNGRYHEFYMSNSQLSKMTVL